MVVTPDPLSSDDGHLRLCYNEIAGSLVGIITGTRRTAGVWFFFMRTVLMRSNDNRIESLARDPRYDTALSKRVLECKGRCSGPSRNIAAQLSEQPFGRLLSVVALVVAIVVAREAIQDSVHIGHVDFGMQGLNKCALGHGGRVVDLALFKHGLLLAEKLCHVEEVYSLLGVVVSLN
jgi:hypothetical protein